MKPALLFALLLALASASSFREIATDVNSKRSTWVAEAPKDGKRLVSLLGTLLDGPRLAERSISVRSELPEEFDPAVQWPRCPSLLEIRDQSVCGSCWAFGAAEAATDRLCIHTNGTNKARLSDVDLLACCKSCGFGCGGGYPSSAWSYMHTTGVTTGGPFGDKTRCNAYPFAPCDHHMSGSYGPCGDTQPTPKCVKKCNEGYNRTWEEDRTAFMAPYSVPSNEQKIQTELMTNGPVEAAFTVYEDFMTYKSGVYQHVSGKQLGGHAVKLVGWGVENGVKYWKLANSWNSEWGEKGFFRILRGKNECGIEGQLVAGLPLPPTRHLRN